MNIFSLSSLDLSKIMQRLDVEDILSLASTCQHFRRSVEQQKLPNQLADEARSLARPVASSHPSTARKEFRNFLGFCRKIPSLQDACLAWRLTPRQVQQAKAGYQLWNFPEIFRQKIALYQGNVMTEDPEPSDVRFETANPAALDGAILAARDRHNRLTLVLQVSMTTRSSESPSQPLIFGPPQLVYLRECERKWRARLDRSADHWFAGSQDGRLHLDLFGKRDLYVAHQDDAGAQQQSYTDVQQLSRTLGNLMRSGETSHRAWDGSDTEFCFRLL